MKSKYKKSPNPIISVDTKKKELIGDLYRAGKLECTEAIEVYDHDYPHLSEGKISPYGIYDIKNNEAFVNVGTSSDTSSFACDSIKLWWNTLGKTRYPEADSILIMPDCGGSNSARSHLFKESLQKLSNEIGLELRVAHYPPYASKWNPIEHRVFPHVTRAMAGVVLKSAEFAKELIKTAATETGLKVFARVSKKTYETGKKVSKDFYANAKIKHDKLLGAWNYVVSPM